MSQLEYQNRQELETEVKDHFKEVETLGEEQKDHQKDLESFREKLRELKSSRGIYDRTDRKLIESVETAAQAREISVENYKEKIKDVKSIVESKLENLTKSIAKSQERIDKMENLVSSLTYKEEGVITNINIEINQQKEDLEDAKQKGSLMKKIVNIAEVITAANVTVEGISQCISLLQSLGLFR